MKKLNEKLAVEHMKVFYPYMRNEITGFSADHNFGGILQILVDDLKDSMRKENILKILNSIKRMEFIYNRGNSYVRYMIENLFIRSFKSIRMKAKPQQWKIICQEMSESFLQIHKIQMNKDELIKSKME